MSAAGAPPEVAWGLVLEVPPPTLVELRWWAGLVTSSSSEEEEEESPGQEIMQES